MRKQITACLLAGVLSFSFLADGFSLPVQAEEDFSDENYWFDKCSKTQTTAAGVKACEAFLDYTKSKKDDLTSQIKDYNKKMSELEKSAEEIEALAQEQRVLIEDLNHKIEEKQERISILEDSINQINLEIAEKEQEIQVWDTQIKTRMKGEQASVGTNMIIDILMGASSFSDMIRRLTGIERITESDQSQVDSLNLMKEQLDFQKQDLVRITDGLIDERNELEEQMNQAEELKKSYEQLETEYQKQLADLKQAKMDAENNIQNIKEFAISAEQILKDTIIPVEGFVFPVKGGSRSAGTWAYDGGGIHLGLDWAAPIGTEIVAPADGVILFASNPADSNSGYLGNWSGYPAGGGNTICMLVNYKGTLLAISFAHLSKEGMEVKAGQRVTQGQKLALSGNSGNSSGPHTHIEIINLGNMTTEQAMKQFAANADFSYGTGWNTTATACENGQAAPCRERPEKYLMSKE